MLFKVNIDGVGEREVDIPAIPETDVKEKYVPLAEHHATVKSEAAKVRKGFDGFVKADSLLDDEAFLERVAVERGDKLRPRLQIKAAPSGEELEKLTRSIEERATKPLLEKVELLSKETAELRIERLRTDVGKACTTLDVADDAPELIELYYERRTRWDPDHKGFFLVSPSNPEEFEPTDFPKRGKAPWKTIEEDLAEIRKSDKKKGWFKAGSSGKPVDLNKPGSGGGGSLAERIAAAEAKGDWTTAATLKREMLDQARASSRS